MRYYIYAGETCVKQASSSRHGRAEREARALGRELGVQCSVSETVPAEAPLYSRAVPVEVEA